MKRLGYATGVSALLITSFTCLGNAASPFDQRLAIDKQVVHVLNRLTFGPRSGDLDQVRRLGVDKWIDLQLHPDRITENPILETRLTGLRTLQLPMWQILEKYPAVPAALMVRPSSAIAFSSLTQQQLARLMNCSVDERRTTLASFAPDTRGLILVAAPPQVLEGLPDDLRQEAASARKAEQEERQKEIRRLMPPLNELLSPEQIRSVNRGMPEEKLALLNSLDAEKRRQIVRALPPQAIAELPGLRRPGLNENYGRELLELHTLGVDGGYTQNDVIAVARAFTGWTIYDPQKFAEFQFNPAVHDRKEKALLGHTIPAMGGEQDGVQVIDILAHHPSTARFIANKLAQRFVADDPPPLLVDRMATTMIKTDGDLRAVLQTMFTSPEFLSEGAWHAKLKSPLEMVGSAVRALNADATDTFGLAQRIADLGETLYGKLEPTGYPNTGEAWTNTAGLLGRINFANALAGGQVPGVKVDISRFNFKDPPTVAGELLNRPPSSSTLAAIEEGVQGKEATPSILATLVLGSPDFQRR